MKTRNFQKPRLTIIALSIFALAAGDVLAQDSTTPTTSAANTQMTATDQAVPQLSYGVPEILQLSRAKVGDSVIINYIHNSGNNYGLNAAQIIYLRQQGVSEAVIDAMLTQHSQTTRTTSTTTTTTLQPAAPVPNNRNTSSVQVAPAAAQSSVVYVPATPSSTVYVIPDTQTYRYNTWYYSNPPYYYSPAYYWPYPAVSFSFGWGNYNCNYSGWHGGYYGGWHGGGGGWHGGGGGWHGGGGHH